MENYRQGILQIIDELRSRKSRPDLNRICHLAEKRHGWSSCDTDSYIEKLVDSEDIAKVVCKGCVSYRNAGKWKKSYLGGNVLNSRSSSDMLVAAVKALTEGQVGGELKGATLRDIERWLVSQKLDRDQLKCPLHVMLQREIDAGSLKRLPDGGYGIGEMNEDGSVVKPTFVRNISHTAKKGRPFKKV